MPDEVPFFQFFAHWTKAFPIFIMSRMVPAISRYIGSAVLALLRPTRHCHFLDSSSNSKEYPLSADCHLGNASRRGACRQSPSRHCRLPLRCRDLQARRCRTPAAERHCLDAARSAFSIEQDGTAPFRSSSGQNNRRILEGAVSHSIDGELPPRLILGYSAGAESASFGQK